MSRIVTETRDERLAFLLATGRSVRAAAKHLRMTERTAYRRLESPDLTRRIQEIRSEIFATAATRLARLSLKAATTLDALLTAESETVRLGACRCILEAAGRLRESVEFDERIAKLEERRAYRP